MKKITVLLGLAFLAFSCSSDDDGSSPEDLVGVWQFTERTIDGVLDEDIDGCTLEETITFTEDEFIDSNYELNNGVCEFVEQDVDPYTASSTTITFDFSDEDEEEMLTTVSYSINGPILIISFVDELEDNDGELTGETEDIVTSFTRVE